MSQYFGYAKKWLAQYFGYAKKWLGFNSPSERAFPLLHGDRKNLRQSPKGFEGNNKRSKFSSPIEEDFVIPTASEPLGEISEKGTGLKNIFFSPVQPNSSAPGKTALSKGENNATKYPINELPGDLLLPTSHSSRKECVDFYRNKFGIREGKTLNADNEFSGGRQVGFKCSGCENFHIKVTNKRDSNLWTLSKTSRVEHFTLRDDGLKIPCASSDLKASSIDVVGNNVMALLIEAPSVSNELREMVGNALGIDASADVLKKATKISKISGTKHVESFSHIEPLLDEVKQLNPDTFVNVERKDGSNEFKRLTIIPHYTKHIVSHMYPVIGIDGAAMKDIIIQSSATDPNRSMLEKMVVTVISGRIPGNENIILGINIRHNNAAACNNYRLTHLQEYRAMCQSLGIEPAIPELTEFSIRHGETTL